MPGVSSGIDTIRRTVCHRPPAVSIASIKNMLDMIMDLRKDCEDANRLSPEKKGGQCETVLRWQNTRI
jgi:hypothetical protein